jgi:hypothetical protein
MEWGKSINFKVKITDDFKLEGENRASKNPNQSDILRDRMGIGTVREGWETNWKLRERTGAEKEERV